MNCLIFAGISLILTSDSTFTPADRLRFKPMKKKIRVAELFAGVGGFRLGLEGWNGKSASSDYKDSIESRYQVVWSNQWEPSTKVQHASLVYEARWGNKGHANEDIASVDLDKVVDHDLLVGGFPCQDYSVATTLKNSKGLIGKKGVLWWAIHRILSEKKNPPKYLFLENVDRLLISPSGQRGRDFAIILKSLDDLGYAVEWRVVNAADYGMPQRRRRVFILAYHKSTSVYKALKKASPEDWLSSEGVIAEALPVNPVEATRIVPLGEDVVWISEKFNLKDTKLVFENSGVMISGRVHTAKTTPCFKGKQKTLKDIMLKSKVSSDFYIDEIDRPKWDYLKGSKKEVRVRADGGEYHYAEGGMVFPDSLDKPSRTIITGEGGKSASRFKHVIETKKGLRRLTPVELERLNMFPDNHTEHELASDAKRAFFMGNALVVGVIEKIGQVLQSRAL
jgi:DNA (cytosine-5)-methyltransferase 1